MEIKLPAQKRPLQLLSHLLELWQKDAERPAADLAAARGFVDFALKRLQENRPVILGYYQSDLAVALQDGTQLIVGVDSGEPTGDMYPGGQSSQPI